MDTKIKSAQPMVNYFPLTKLCELVRLDSGTINNYNRCDAGVAESADAADLKAKLSTSGFMYKTEHLRQWLKLCFEATVMFGGNQFFLV